MRTIQNIEVFPIRLPITNTFRFASGSAGMAINQPSCSLISQGIRVIRTSGLYAMTRMPASVTPLCLMSPILCNLMKR